jgi:hypothetical protein
MTNAQLQIKIKERLNKLASLDYDNFECWQIVEAFNKAQLEWFRRQINGINQLQSGDGSTKINYDDTQKLIVTIPMVGTASSNPPENWTSVPFPTDYLYYSSMYVMAKNDCCPDRNIIVYMIDKADLYITLRDENKKPSFDWGETVAVMADNQMIVYTGGEFEITSADFTYYRLPTPVQFLNCIDVSTGLPTGDVPCEFKDDIAEILVDNAVAILAADIESFNQYTRATNSVNNNT